MQRHQSAPGENKRKDGNFKKRQSNVSVNITTLIHILNSFINQFFYISFLLATTDKMPYGHVANIDIFDSKIIYYDSEQGWSNTIQIEDIYRESITFNVFIYKIK